MASTDLAPDGSKSLITLVHGLGVFGVFGPLLVWVWKRKLYSSVDVEGIEALNFQIQAALVEILLGLISLFFIGGLLVVAAWVYRVAMALWAALVSSADGTFRYPFLVTRWLVAPVRAV